MKLACFLGGAKLQKPHLAKTPMQLSLMLLLGLGYWSKLVFTKCLTWQSSWFVSLQRTWDPPNDWPPWSSWPEWSPVHQPGSESTVQSAHPPGSCTGNRTTCHSPRMNFATDVHLAWLAKEELTCQRYTGLTQNSCTWVKMGYGTAAGFPY